MTKINKEYIFKNLFNKNNKLNSMKLKNINIPKEYNWCSTKTEFIHCILNDIISQPLCSNCKDKKTKWMRKKKTYNTYCSKKCDFSDKNNIINNNETIDKEYIYQNLFNKNNNLNPHKLKYINIPKEYNWCSTKAEYIYCILNDITSQPLCIECKQNHIKYKTSLKKYSSFCSSKCSNTNKNIINQKAKTLKNNNDKIIHPKNINKQYIKKYLLKKDGNLNSNKIANLIIAKEYGWCSTKNEYIYCILNDITSQPLCIECKQNHTKYNTKFKKYNEFCSPKCSSSNKETQQKTIETNIKKYNIIHHLKLDSQKKKQQETNLIKYGNKTCLLNPHIKQKSIETNIKKYGVENPFESQKIKKKIIQSNIERFGCSNPFQSEDIKNKIKITNMDKYGYLTPSHKNIKNYNEYLILLKNKDFSKWIKNETFLIIDFMNHFGLTRRNVDLLKYRNNINTPNKKEGFINEKKLFDFIIKKNSNKKVKQNEYSKIKPYELDLYIENKDNKKIGIEYNGLMFHSFGKSKYSMFNNYEDEKNIILEEKYKELYQINQKTYKNNEKHLLKTELCENKNIKLFHINENEWLDTNKQLIWKSIINNELGNNIIKIGARNTYIKELNSKNKKHSKLKKEFLENNHIQGNIASNTNIGLFTKKIEHNFNKFKWYPSSNQHNFKNINNSNENNLNYPNMIINKIIYLSNLNNNKLYIIPKDSLVSLMTFGKPRFNKEYNWELLRFCNKTNSSIVGAGTKLLKYFKNNYMKEDDKLISYGNRRWTNFHNNFYINNGFNFLRKSEPSFYYFHESNINKLYHRTHFQKYKLENYFNQGKYNIIDYDKSLPAQIIMYNNGYRKVWDSGNIVFELSHI